MSSFYCVATKAINDYKLWLRRTFPSSYYVSKIRELEIKRISLRTTNEVELFDIGMRIINDLDQYNKNLEQETVTSSKTTNYSYHGSREFLDHLKNQFSQYIIDGSKVINANHKVAAALVNAIQLLSLSDGQPNVSVVEKVKGYFEFVSQHGNTDQKSQLDKILKQHNFVIE